MARYRHDHPETHDARGMVQAMVRELADAKKRARAAGSAASENKEYAPLGLLDELGVKTTLPAWGYDESRIKKGQAVFADNGLYQAVALFFVSLPLGYALPASAKVLYAVSDLADRDGKLTRRVAETGQMLIDVMGLRDPESLKPGGAGYTTAIGVRALHSAVRALMLDPAHRWKVEADGPPANQELLLATLFDFSVVIWGAMQRMGLELSRDDRAANLYVWSVFGHLMGLMTCRDRPLTLDDADPVCAHFGSMLEASDEGRALMRALLTEMEEFMPLGWRKLPRSLIRWLFREADFGVHRVPDLLAVPKGAWWSTPLFVTARMAQRFTWVPDPLRPAIRLLVRKAGRVIISSYADRYSDGRAPFWIPAELARDWKIRQIPAARRARLARGRARRAVRGNLRHLRPGMEARRA
ncbi:MAG TPA: oxygenase MpaB family protein [Streptosporangiaceae bacterium]|nr:oxygenase MpaB family protein [Streptosporangiaceae bacterium]